MNMDRRLILLKIIFFLGIGAFIFVEVQNLLIPKWYYPDVLWDAPSRTFSGFYEETENSMDVIAIGTSVMVYGYSPMHAYDVYGIKSCNLASSAQPIQMTYYMLKEALKTQVPKVIIMDTSSLYMEENSEPHWRYVLDNMPISLNKIELAYEFSQQDISTGFLSAIVPMWRYHDRWKELSERDWTDKYREKSYYTKGFSMYSDQKAAYFSQDEINEYFRLKAELNNLIIDEYEDSQFYKIEGEKIYDYTVSKEKLEWLKNIKYLCEAQNVDLLMVNVPKNDSIKGWNSMKYQEVKEICQNYNLEYFDMMYDYDIGIEWNTDTVDYGRHLNLLGANKVSESLGSFLVQNYKLNLLKNADWDKELVAYRTVEDIAMLQLENDFEGYIRKLSDKYLDKTILISVSDDFYNGLNENDVNVLKEIGLQSEFQDAYRKSFVAVIEKGEVEYEALSNGMLDYSGVTTNNHKYRIISSGWLTGAEAQIWVNDDQFAVNRRGLNIVLYDDDLNMVLDSVCFDTFLDDHTCIHQSASELLKKFENYVIENGVY